MYHINNEIQNNMLRNIIFATVAISALLIAILILTNESLFPNPQTPNMIISNEKVVIPEPTPIRSSTTPKISTPPSPPVKQIVIPAPIQKQQITIPNTPKTTNYTRPTTTPTIATSTLRVIVIPATPVTIHVQTIIPAASSTSQQQTTLTPASLRWKPTAGQSWQIQFANPNVQFTDSAYAYDLDMYDTTVSKIVEAHSANKKVICYINAGSWEDWRTDAAEFPKSVIGKAYQGWPGENWLDIRQISMIGPIIAKRIAMCASKGFDAVEFDNVNSFENDTGFPLTDMDQLNYNKWLAYESHKNGLAIGLKNDSSQTKDLVNYFDFAITESCAAEGWCGDYQMFINQNKPVFVIEYLDTINSAQFQNYCKQLAPQKYSLILKNRNLDGYAEYCRP